VVLQHRLGPKSENLRNDTRGPRGRKRSCDHAEDLARLYSPERQAIDKALALGTPLREIRDVQRLFDPHRKHTAQIITEASQPKCDEKLGESRLDHMQAVQRKARGRALGSLHYARRVPGEYCSDECRGDGQKRDRQKTLLAL